MDRLKLLGCLMTMAMLPLPGCGGGGNGQSVEPPPPPPPGEVLRDLKIPGYENQIDVYKTDGATRAVVFLHGGKGTNYGLANKLGLNLGDSRPTTGTANWTWLAGKHILAVFPQGVAIPQAPDQFTWRNWVMDSGQDDVDFLTKLVARIKAEYRVDKVYLFGHSNGGMMGNRMWCEEPTVFDGYVTASGPASSRYVNTACTPLVKRPYLGIIGGADTILQTAGHWTDELWTLTPLVTSSPAFVTNTVIGEWQQHVARAQLACGETPTLLGKSSDNVVDKWSNCGGRIQVQEVLHSEHGVEELDAELAKSVGGKKLIDLLADFMDGPAAR